MNKFDKGFIMDLFLDNDNISTSSRLVFAVANLVSECNENISLYNEMILEEDIDQRKTKRTNGYKLSGMSPIPQVSVGFYESSIVNYSDEEFIEKFKMKHSTVKTLINFLSTVIKHNNPLVTLDKKVYVFLWFLISDSSYSEVGKLFGLPKSTVTYIFEEIGKVLIDQMHNFISWPSLDQQQLTRMRVNSKYELPNCVGFLDACRFKIGSKRYKKRKPDIVLLQAVCNESLKFIDIHIGDIGETNKWRVYKGSELPQKIKNNVAFENHILGNSQYKLRKKLITPILSKGMLTIEEMKFNAVHLNTQVYIGRAFELLKGRFKKLNHIEFIKTDTINTLICVTCILHNFILSHEGLTECKEESNKLCNDAVSIDVELIKTATDKRKFLCNYIM